MDNELYEELLKRVTALEEEVASLKARIPAADEETIRQIVGAVAAYMGVKAKVRSIKYVRSSRWAQIGRQAVHRHDITS